MAPQKSSGQHLKTKRDSNRELLSRKDLAKNVSPPDRKLPTGQTQSRREEAEDPETRQVIVRGTPDELKITKLKITKSEVICSPSRRTIQTPSRRLPPKTKTKTGNQTQTNNCQNPIPHLPILYHGRLQGPTENAKSRGPQCRVDRSR